MPQTSLAEYVENLNKAGLLTRYKEERRVDGLLALMEARLATAMTVPARWRPRFSGVLIGAGCSACSPAPAQDVFGSFVPSWLLCALIGIAGAIVCRLTFGVAGLSDHLLLPPLTYIGITVAITLAVWLLWFEH